MPQPNYSFSNSTRATARAEARAAHSTKASSAAVSQDPSLERTFQGHSGDITGLAWNQSEDQLASGSVDNSVIVWNFTPRLRAFRYEGHTVS